MTSTVPVLGGSDISLHLRQTQILSYVRNGSALEVTLVDGRVIVLEGFFGPDGAQKADLFISSDGLLHEVTLVPGEGGLYYSNYIAQDVDGKWSPNDDLYFVDGGAGLDPQVIPPDDEAGMLAALPLFGGGLALPLLGLIGLGAGTTVLGENEEREDPEATILTGTKDAGHVVNAADRLDGVDITGTGTVGATVAITINGVTETTVIGADGKWAVRFDAADIDEGTYETGISVLVTKDSRSITITDTLVVDTEIAITFDADGVATDGIVNKAEIAGSVTLRGTVEAGSTVTVVVNEVSYTAVVTGTAWSVALPAGVLSAGEYVQGVTIRAVDAHGNPRTIEGSFSVDTVTAVTINTNVETDGIVNAAERADGVTLTGTAEAGASVVVTLGGVSRTVTASAQGTWSAAFTATEIPGGTYTATATAVATDAAGNTATVTGSFGVDTTTAVTINTNIETDGIVNASERGDGITLTGTAEAGARVVVTVGAFSHTVTANAQGVWSAVFAAGEIPVGTYTATATAVATDAAGNSATVTGSFGVDTATALTINSSAIGGNGVVNASERDGGVTITGTAEANARVIVTVGTVSHTVTANAQGVWSSVFTASEVPAGTYSATVTATSTDAAGNAATATGSFGVDTITAVTVNTNIETDGIVNAVERADGIILTGTAEAGASVVVQFNGASRTVTATSGGTWTANFAAGDVPQGEGTAGVRVTATDVAGNTATTTGTINIDTYVNRLDVTSARPGGDGVINQAEAGRPIIITGVVEVGSTVNVVLAGVTRSASVAADGTWTVTFAGGLVAAGEYDTTMVVNATDRAGNTASLTQAVRVDTEAGMVTLSPDPIEGNDIVNFVERSDGVLIHGTATAGLTVTVTFNGVAHQVVAAPNGTWSSLFLSSEIQQGTYTATITASITDSAGNSRSVSDTVNIDTSVSPFTINNPIEGDDIVSGAEATDGVIISGTVEAGSTVRLNWNGTVLTSVAGTDGAWSVNVPAGAIPAGEGTMTFVATATDLAGNTATITDSVRIDTIVNRLTLTTPIEGDNMVNRAEASDGITFTGTVEAGSTVMVTFGGVTRAATVGTSGSWTVAFTGAEVPAGEYTGTVTVRATDAVGNTRNLTGTFQVDTTPPEAPSIESYTRTSSGSVRGMTTSITDDQVSIDQVLANGSVSRVNYTTTLNTQYGELSFNFQSAVPNGSHLVMTAADSTGNNTSTLFVLEETGTNSVNIGNAGYDRFNIEAIDLQFAEDSQLTLTVSDLESLADHSNALTIHGGTDDTVTALGAVRTSETEVIDGHTYRVYDFGSNGGTLIIDEDVRVVT